DEPVLAGLLAECSAQLRDALIEAVLLDNGCRPDALHQVRLADRLPDTLDQDGKGLECPRRQGHWAPVSCQVQQALAAVEAKPAELIDTWTGLGHTTSSIYPCGQHIRAHAKVLAPDDILALLARPGRRAGAAPLKSPRRPNQNISGPDQRAFRPSGPSCASTPGLHRIRQ